MLALAIELRRRGARTRDINRELNFQTEALNQHAIVSESPWKWWRLLTLETRMESCRRNKRRESPRHGATALRRRPPQYGWSGPCVELGSEHGTIQRVAGQLGYGVESVRSWVRQADIDDGYTGGVSTTDARRIRELERENRELKRANEILKRAASFFGAELDRHTRNSRLHRRPPREFGVEPICTVLRSAGVSVAPSTYYAAKSRGPSPRACRDAVLGPALVELWRDNYCVYRARKLWKTARRAGHDVGRDQVARLMRGAGIEGYDGANGPHHQTRPEHRTPSRSGRARLHRDRAQPVVGDRPDLRSDLGGRGLCLLYHRCLQPDDRRLAGCLQYADHDGPRRDWRWRAGHAESRCRA